MREQESLMRRGPVAVPLVLMVVGLLAAFVLLMSQITADTEDHGRVECGSVLSVLRTGDGYRGGEFRTDQAAFDRRCREKARSITPLIKVAGAAGLVSSGVLVFGVGLERRRRNLRHML